MRRFVLVAGTLLFAGLAYAISDADPWEAITTNKVFMRPTRFEQEARFANVDAGSIATNTLTATTFTVGTSESVPLLTVVSDAGIGGNASVAGTFVATGVSTLTGGAVVAGASTFTNTKNAGTRLLDGGAQTITVTAGEVCVCGENTDATKGVKCPVSSTTATIGGTTGDTISYICF